MASTTVLRKRKSINRPLHNSTYGSVKLSSGDTRRFRFVKQSDFTSAPKRVLRNLQDRNEKFQSACGFVLWANYLLAERGKRDSAIDLLFDDFDGLMRNGEIRRIRRILVSLKYTELDTDILLAILTATLPVRSLLPERHSAFLEIQRVICERNEMEDGLLDGLE